jgi:hypothetical protein
MGYGGWGGWGGNWSGNMPDLNTILAGWWGNGYGGSGLAAIVGNASNIVVGTNPPYTLNDFAAIYPNFLGPQSRFTATATQGSPVLTTVAVTGTGSYGVNLIGPGGSGDIPLEAAGVQSGQFITGPGIPNNTYIFNWGSDQYNYGPYSGGGYGESSILLTNPVDLTSVPYALAGMQATTTISSPTLTGIANTATAFAGGPLLPGMQLFGNGIPAGTTIQAIPSPTTVTMTQQATVSGTTGVQVFQPQALNPLIIYEQPFVPIPVLQIYLNLALACLQQQLYFQAWPLAMALFVAHFATLFARSSGQPATSVGQVAASGLQFGILTSKSVGGVSAGYTNWIAQEWFSYYGAMVETTYGVQLISIANAITPRFIYVP